MMWKKSMMVMATVVIWGSICGGCAGRCAMQKRSNAQLSTGTYRFGEKNAKFKKRNQRSARLCTRF